MRKVSSQLFIFLLFFSTIGVYGIQAQIITKDIPESPQPGAKYLFYLHGGVVQDQGANAVSKYYGKYEYSAILDTLKNKGFYVISEVRPRNTKEKEYAVKLERQINHLLSHQVPPENIIIVGASLGAYIGLETALRLKNKTLRYVLLGLCSEYAIQYFSNYKEVLYGQFLSIYEQSDSKGSCSAIFKNTSKKYNFTEVSLTMGIDHAFLFKPYKEWINPLVDWVNAK